MAPPKETRWPIEPHTKVKHLILRRYLGAWLPIMARYNGRIVFIDGFAGPGRYSGGEEGSPLIALRALLDHPHFRKPQVKRHIAFLFIELEGDRATALRQELMKVALHQKIPKWVETEVREGEFAPLMTTLLDELEREGQKLAPTFAFIDPFGFARVPMELICRIARNHRCECLITFMYEAINRFLATPEVAIQARFDELFGTAEWRALAGETDPGARRDGIVNLYRRQLIEKAHFGYVRTFEMINEGNRTEYFLYFATSNPVGLSKMKEAMWRADPVQGQVFSDRTVTDQPMLLEPTADLGRLRNLLKTRFAGQAWVSIDQVAKFVLEDTPYSEAIHLKRRTLAPMEREKPISIQVRRPRGSPNRPGDYPAGTQVKFV